MRRNISSRVIQRDTVARISVEFLFRNYIFGYFNRVNLVKIDIEGLDQKVVTNILDFYDRNEIGSLDYLPCVIVYEANGLDGFDASDNVDMFKRGKDLNLIYRLENYGYRIIYVWEYGQMTWSDNYAINCLCSAEELDRATGLLFGAVTPPVIHYEEFSNICTSERLLMVKAIV